MLVSRISWLMFLIFSGLFYNVFATYRILCQQIVAQTTVSNANDQCVHVEALILEVFVVSLGPTENKF